MNKTDKKRYRSKERKHSYAVYTSPLLERGDIDKVLNLNTAILLPVLYKEKKKHNNVSERDRDRETETETETETDRETQRETETYRQRQRQRQRQRGKERIPLECS
jgi:hypothetical protein